MANRPNYPAAILANFDGDYRRAYEHLSKMYLALEQGDGERQSSRFIEVSRLESDMPICVQKVTEDHISRAVDMADCDLNYVMRKWLYCDDNGELHPVTIGRQERINRDQDAPFCYASSAIVANGQCVGDVTYTDH